MSEKLVRDKIAEFVFKERGEVLSTRIAAPEEIKQFLLNKVIEESHEVFTAQTKENLAEELADLLEVIKALAEKEGIVDDLFSKREAKFLERGGFDLGVVLITESKK